MPSRKPPASPQPASPAPRDHAAPVIQPANEVLRRPEPNVIDQRQQQIDPAGRHRADVNAPASESMKQPGGEGPAPGDARPGALPDKAE